MALALVAGPTLALAALQQALPPPARRCAHLPKRVADAAVVRLCAALAIQEAVQALVALGHRRIRHGPRG